VSGESFADAPTQPAVRRRRRGLLVGTIAVLLCAAGGATILVTDPFAHPAKAAPASTDGTALATVTRRDLTAQTQVQGTLGYDGTYTVLNQGHGTITWLPALGAVIRQGHPLYRLDGAPVLLLYGHTPAWRDLAEGASADPVTGPDVRQLNAALVALGYASRDDLDPHSDEFGWATKAAVERLQDHFGLEQTGRLPLGSVVFLPRAARVATLPVTRGAPAPPGATVLTATSTKRVVSIALDVAQQSQVRTGNPVQVTLPDGRTAAGVITDVGRVATAAGDGQASDSSDSSATIAVTATLRRPRDAGRLDQAPVLVGIVTGRAPDALVVPVTALLALAGGGYGVELAGADGSRRIVPVTTGLFDDAGGLVQVTGADLAPGRRVVVPSS
jgi:peptidoglycan hydrolase-like protein with peptidoglycan-binding domain